VSSPLVKCWFRADMLTASRWCLFLAVSFHGQLVAERDVLLLVRVWSKRRS
jgi:hypothetical protein